MTPRSRIRRRRRSSSRHGHDKTSPTSSDVGAAITTFLLAIVLITGPLILGSVRLWIELPLLGAMAFLLMIQGIRLTATPSTGETRRIDAIDLAVVLFVLYAIVRWLTSPVEYFSRIEVMEVVAYAGVFLTCRYGMANRKYCMLLLYGLVILGVGETVIGYYLSNHLDWFPFGLTERQQLDYAPRWLGTYESPDHYACFLVMAIGAALALGSFSKLAWPLRIFLFYFSFMMIVGVMYSGSRGSWIALLASIIALVVMGIRNGTMRWWVPVTGGVLLMVIAGVLFSVSAVARERVMGPQYSGTAVKLDTGVRFQLTVDALRIARNHPFFGTGPATFPFKHLPYQAGPVTLKSELTRDDYLNCLADYGLVGFGIALFFIVAVTLKFFRPLWIDSRWQDRVVVATGFAAWMALLVHSLVDSNLHIPANALLLFSLTGLAVGRFREEKQPHWSSLSLAPWGRWLGGAIIFISLLYGAQVAWTAKGSDMAAGVPKVEHPIKY